MTRNPKPPGERRGEDDRTKINFVAIVTPHAFRKCEIDDFEKLKDQT